MNDIESRSWPPTPGPPPSNRYAHCSMVRPSGNAGPALVKPGNMDYHISLENSCYR